MNKDQEFDQLRQRLRQTREYLNLSQQFVADNAGISRSALADIERGARKVESLELQRLARVYRYPVSYFLGDADTLAASDDTTSALNRAAADLTPKDREEVLRFAQFLRFYGESGKKKQ
jgi:transcriptional regulator with XRE-family HTH domain